MNLNWVVAEGIIAADVGGWYVREAGIFDSAGDMIYIIKYPETYKPVLVEGSTRDLVIRPIMAVADATNVTLVIDPAVAAASQDYVNTTFVKKAGDTMTGDLTVKPVGENSNIVIDGEPGWDAALHLREDTDDAFVITHDVSAGFSQLSHYNPPNPAILCALTFDDAGDINAITGTLKQGGVTVATTAYVLQAILDGLGLGKSLGENGYATLPGGLILQWGKTTTLTGEGSQTITLPIVWPNAGLVAHATPIRSAPTSNATAAAGAVLVSNNQITVVLDHYNSAVVSGVYWFAIGW